MAAALLWAPGAPRAAPSSPRASGLLPQTVLLPGGSRLFWVVSQAAVPIFHPPEARQIFKVTSSHPLSGLNLTDMPVRQAGPA